MAAPPPETGASTSVSKRDEHSTTETLLDHPDADIVLRSSDSRDFRVLKLYIIKRSPVLDGLIQASSESSSHPSATTDPTSTDVSPPIVHMSESGVILRSLLTFILPMQPVLPPSVKETMELLSVAQKYEMSHILAYIRGIISLQDPPLIRKDNALDVYSTAQKYGPRQEVIQAARLTLKSALTIENLESKLDVISSDHLHELWKYHQRVQEKLVSNIDGFRGSEAYKALNGLNCADRTPSGTPKWIDDYICSMTVTPSSFSLFEFQSALARHVSDNTRKRCSFCTCLPEESIDKFWTALTAFMHANLEEAESDFFVIGEDTSSNPIGFAAVTLPLPECLDVSNADVVIQSSDFANFRIHKLILSSSSQVFRDIFSLPQPSDNDTVDGLPFVRLSEDAELVRALMTVLYPIPPEIPTSYEKVLALLAAAQKYEMSAVQSSVRAEVVRRELSVPGGAQTFRAFAIAFSNKLSPEMGTIARLTLDYPLTFETLGDELLTFQGSALRELAGFRKMCRDNIVSCLESFLDAQKGPSKIWVDCPKSKVQQSTVAQPSDSRLSNSRQSRGGPASSGGIFGQSASSLVIASSTVPWLNDNARRILPPWLHDLFTQQIEDLKRYFTHALIKPSGIREKYLAALVKHSTSNDCPTCLMVHAQNGEGYCAELEQKLTHARNQVLVFA